MIKKIFKGVLKKGSNFKIGLRKFSSGNSINQIFSPEFTSFSNFIVTCSPEKIIQEEK